jgi:hypothetical protein
MTALDEVLFRAALRLSQKAGSIAPLRILPLKSLPPRSKNFMEDDPKAFLSGFGDWIKTAGGSAACREAGVIPGPFEIAPGVRRWSSR